MSDVVKQETQHIPDLLNEKYIFCSDVTICDGKTSLHHTCMQCEVGFGRYFLFKLEVNLRWKVREIYATN